MKIEIHTHDGEDEILPRCYVVFDNVFDLNDEQFQAFLASTRIDNLNGIQVIGFEDHGRAVINLKDGTPTVFLQLIESAMKEEITVEHYHNRELTG